MINEKLIHRIEQLEIEIKQIKKRNDISGFIKKAFSKINVLVGVGVTILLTSMLLWAAQISFTDGTIISAVDVNANFTELYDAIANFTELDNAVTDIDTKLIRGFEQIVWVDSLFDGSSTTWTTCRQMTYQKQREDTVLLIEYEENSTIRAYTNWNNMSIRILIDGYECTDPGPIEKDFLHYSPSDDIFFTDNLYTRAACRAANESPILDDSHTIEVQVRRNYCTANCWGPYLSYNVAGTAHQTARLSVQEVPNW